MSSPVASVRTPAAVREPRARTHFGLGVALVAATFLAYWPAVSAGFIWNDSDYVTAPALRSAAGLGRIWFELGATEQYYPVLHSAFWIEHRLWGDSPGGYHILNILLHAGAACLMAAVVQILFLRRAENVPATVRAGDGERHAARIGWLAAFLFALHPVCVESVAWISEQKNTLSLVFYLVAALLYLQFDAARRARRYWGATVFFVLALLSKTTTATLPAALLVVFWWQRGRLEWRRDVRPLIPWLGIGAAMGLFSAFVEREYIGAKGSEFSLDLVQRTLLAGRIAWFYVGKLIWPGDLIFIYPRWTIDAAQLWQWLFLAAAIAVIAAAWRWRRTSRGVLAAALCFGGSLFPVLGFFNVYAFMFSFVADHWQYLPSLGLVVLAAAALTRLLAPAHVGLRRGLPVLLVGGLGVLSFHQSRMYADMRTFYRTTLERNPSAWMAHNNLGNLLVADGRLDDAIAHFEAALRVRPDLAKVHNNLATCFRDLKRPQDAIAHYQRAIALEPNYGDAHNNLGRVLREAGRLDEARDHLLKAVQLDPEYPDAWNNLGMVLRDQGRLPEARANFERAVRLDPSSAPAHLNLAFTLSMLGRDDEARQQYEEARRLNPKIPPLPGM